MMNRIDEPLQIMNDFKDDPIKLKSELSKLDTVTLLRFKNYLTTSNTGSFDSILSNLKEVIGEKSMVREDEGGGMSTGTAMVGQSSVAGMGAVVSSQPGSVPGTFGTDGSGDIGVPFSTIGGAKLAQKIPAPSFIRDRRRRKGMSHGARTGKPSRFTAHTSDIRDLKASKTTKVDDLKPKKVMNFNDFQVDKINQVTTAKESINEGSIKNVMMTLQTMTPEIALSKIQEIGLKEFDIQELAKFIADTADDMFAEGELEPVKASDIPLSIFNKNKLDQVVNLVNDILFGRK